MIGQNDLYGREFQTRLLANLLRASEFRQHLLSNTLSQQDLDIPCHRAILQAVTTFTTEHRAAIERANGGIISANLLNGVLIAMIRTGEIAQSEIPDIDDMMDLLFTIRLDTQIMLAMLPAFLLHQRTRKAINSRIGSPEFSPNDILDEMHRIQEVTRSMQADSSVVITPHNPRIALPTDTSPPIPLGIDTLDTMLGGGVKRKKVVMICAYTGYGKSTLGLNIAWRNAEGRGRYGATGLRSVFVTAEMPYEECLCRYYSMLLAYPFETIWKGDVSNNRSRAQVNDEIHEILYRRAMSDEVVARSQNNFTIWDFSTKTLTPGMIEQQLRAEAANGTPVDVLVIDYIDKMTLDAGAKNMTFKQDRRVELGKISVEIEQLAIMFNCLIVVLTQANDDGARRSSVRLTASRDARLKNDPVSLWMGLGTNEADRKNNIYRLTIDKNRDGATFPLNISGRLDIQRFVDYTEEASINQQFGAAARRQREPA
jgi:KaiC/GvpD/RAD55 family RecA-like ATPase